MHVRALFTATIFLGSCLLFLVQPMAARIVLPAFGGTPAVWSASMVFFQAALLLGYAYAHFSVRKFGPRKQSLIHLGVVGLALFTLPFATRPWLGANGQTSPALTLIAQLALLVGATFFAVSANAPTLQRWFADTNDRDAHDPYFLYAASNVGSLVALLAYPTLIEPRLDLHQQTLLWMTGYIVLGVLLALSGWALRRSPQGAHVVEAVTSPSPTRAQRVRWVALAAIPSSLLLGATNFLSSNIAPIPLLWVVPLGLYLITFILAFAKRPLASSTILGRIVPLLATPLALAIVLEASEPIAAIATLHLFVFFLAAWMCHARLSEMRPKADHLTEFFLWVSVGGVLGGIFNALVAPVIFSTWFEYPLALCAALVVRPAIKVGASRPRWVDLGYGVMVLAVAAGLAYEAQHLGMAPGPGRTAMVIGLPAILSYAAIDYPWRSGLGLLGFFIAANLFHVSADAQVVLTERSFFGVHRVMLAENGRFRRLMHGNTIHGLQDAKHPETPLTYYYPTGPIGTVFKNMPPERMQNVALVGLGVGSLAAYGKPGQRMTYYEIDPLVEKIARDDRYFTFLRDTKADLRVVLGDARLTFRDTPDNAVDLVVLDAFSSDAIPVHLLTQEAIEMYFRKLKPHGFLAAHISNRYLDLTPVFASVAHRLGFTAYEMVDGAMAFEKDAGKQESHWVVLARRKEDLAPLLSKSVDWSELENPTDFRTWTDDFSNVLDVFHPEK